MNSSDWKEFAKEKPMEGQPILTISNQGSISRFAFYPIILQHHWTHWQPWADPPKPDPFEEFWKTRLLPRTLNSETIETYKSWCQNGWEGHERWAREHPEDK